MHTHIEDVGNEIPVNQYVFMSVLSFSGTLLRKTATSIGSIAPRMFFLNSLKVGGGIFDS
jgi:hypothetical protein